MECPFIVDQWVVRFKKGSYRGWEGPDFEPSGGSPPEPAIGQPVRIATIFPWNSDNTVYLTLKGFDQRLWMCWRLFRPLQNRPAKANISELKRLTNPANHKVFEDA